MRISDWSSDVCSSDLQVALVQPDLINLELECQFRHEIPAQSERQAVLAIAKRLLRHSRGGVERCQLGHALQAGLAYVTVALAERESRVRREGADAVAADDLPDIGRWRTLGFRSEEHTSELQSIMRISYAAFCLQTKKRTS